MKDRLGVQMVEKKTDAPTTSQCTTRCTGHCCRSFSIPYSPAELQNAVKDLAGPLTAHQEELKFIHSMVIYLGQFQANPLLRLRGESWTDKALYIAQKEKIGNRQLEMEVEQRHRTSDHGQHWYACRHVQLNGDCSVYEKRPSMCRNYPNGRQCEFADCTWSKEEQEKHFEERYPDRIKSLELVPAKMLIRKKDKPVQLKEKK